MTEGTAVTAGTVASHLPEHPLVTIRPGRARLEVDLRNVWAYRELLYFLIWRDIKVRYKQTVLGAAWAVLQPLGAMLVFSLFLGKLVGIPSDGVPYPIFVFAGLLPWTYFSNAVTNSGNSLVTSAALITKVYFPRMVIPAAAVGAGLVDFAIAFFLLLVLMVYYGIGASWRLAALPLLAGLTTLLAFSVGLGVSALNLKYRDVRYALPFMIQLWMFATPIIYPASLVPVHWRWVLSLNPLAGIIEGYRAALFGRTFDLDMLAVSTAATLGVLGVSATLFRRMEKSFADIV